MKLKKINLSPDELSPILNGQAADLISPLVYAIKQNEGWFVFYTYKNDTYTYNSYVDDQAICKTIAEKEDLSDVKETMKSLATGTIVSLLGTTPKNITINF